MKKDLVIHFSYFIALFVVASLVKGWFAVAFIPFWLGGILGTLLPDIDYLIYVYVIKPKGALSVEASKLIAQKEIKRSFSLLSKQLGPEENLIIHTSYFQLMFVAFSFLILTSSGSLFGRGLVLAFLLHLFIDQLIDYIEKGDFESWFTKLPFKPDKMQRVWYLAGNALAILLLALYF